VRDTLVSCAALLRMSWRQHRPKTAVSVVLMLANSAAQPLMALALKALTDAAVDGDAGRAGTAGVFVAVFLLGVLTLEHFAHVAYFELSEMNLVAMDEQLIALANGSARIEHHERPDYADKVAVLRQELNHFGWGIYALLSLLALGVAMVITAVLLAILNPVLLLLPLVAVPPLLMGRRAEATLDRARDAAATSTRAARHMFSLATSAGPAKELRLFRLQDEVRRRHRAHWNDASEILGRAEKRASLLRSAGLLVFAFGYVGAVLLVVRDAIAGRSSVGDVVLAITLAAQVNQQVIFAVTMLRELQRMTQAHTRFRWLRDLIAAQQPPAPDTATPDRIRTGVELRGVGFRYPGTDRTVLSDVDLVLPAGSTVALVGENGAGKTTLVKLLCRFYDVTEGVITLDGVDITRFPLDQWRERISAGFQDFARFEFLARETVGVGHLPRIDDTDAVGAALDRAGASDVVGRLDQGLATQLGKAYADGAELSGGQWQKLALGRAMMRERPLLLFLDEPTSALDAEAEHALFERYADNARRVGKETGAITVLVSHRFSTVGMADLILVVEDGRITEAGDHETLLRSGGLYAELYRIQAAAYE
jgi:ATP-binding cassette subfamily B protein